jgi:hypothetical protein
MKPGQRVVDDRVFIWQGFGKWEGVLKPGFLEGSRRDSCATS